MGLSTAAISAVVPQQLLQPALADPMNPLVQFWLSRQQGSSRKLLAPILASEQRLRQAQALLSAPVPDTPQVLQLVRASSLNCYMFEPINGDSFETRASLLTQSLQLSDPCTFRIITRSITELLPVDKQKVGRQVLEEVIRSYQLLDMYLEMAVEGRADAAQKAQPQLDTTLEAVVKLEGFVREVLKVAA